MTRAIRVAILSLLVSCVLGSPSVGLGSRSVLREIGAGKGGDRRDYAVDLNATDFDSVLKDTPAAHSVVEFFAHWCPACRNYKPQYEKVARLFNGPDAVHPGMILMARIDCASKINIKLCDRFSVNHYPMLFWGPPSKFVGGSWEPKLEKTSELQLIDDMRTADRLLNWINKKIGSSFRLDDEKFENEHLHENVTDPGQIARAIYDVEEATATAFDIIYENKMVKSDTRASLIRFLQMLVAHHPSKRCRKGSAEILVNFDDSFPSNRLLAVKDEEADGKQPLARFQICGKDVPRGYWMFCRGSNNETRGFSCGLWVFMHSLSVRIDDGESQFAFNAICDFVHNFFICDECRLHFYEMCSNTSDPFKKTRDLALWLWRAHNKVNARLLKVEESLETGDPKFPKMIWPPKQLCSSCYRSHIQKNGEPDWDDDVVFEFLTGYYGKTLVSLHKNKDDVGKEKSRALEDLAVSTSAFMVPMGAALAIAVASCAFGALACFWRSRQKSRKPRRNLS